VFELAPRNEGVDQRVDNDRQRHVESWTQGPY
jgi:hypothetical protein